MPSPVTCNVQALLDSASCFACTSPGMAQILRVSIWASILSELSGESVTVNQLLDRGRCFACISPGEAQILRVQLLCEMNAALSGTPSPTPPAPPVNDPVFDNLTHYWRGNEAAGSPRADSKGSIDLVESGGSVNSASGIDGNCASISSSNFLDSVVDVFPGINLPSSLMLWFKAPLLASLDLWKSAANDGSPFATLSSNQMVPGNSGDGGGLLDYNYTANTWHLVVLTSTSGGVQSCSFDGAPVVLSDDQVPQSFTGSCGIGQNWAAGTVLIGEVGVFNVALTSAECATLWNGGIGKFYRP